MGMFFALFSGGQNNPEVKAIQLFNSGNFTEAEKIFKKLLEQNPDNPMSNYYYGASRTENKHYGDQEMEYLLTAGKHITPDRLHYYLGIQHHARGNWNQALKFYNQFRLSVPEIEQKELELDKKIQLCFNQVNPFDTTHMQSADGELKDSEKADPEIISSPFEEETVSLSASTSNDELIPEADNKELLPADDLFIQREALPNLPGVEPTLPAGDFIQFQVNNIITYNYTSQFQTEKGKILFDKGKELQLQQNNYLREADRLRAKYGVSQSLQEREDIAAKIIELEKQSFQLQQEIKTAFEESRYVENNFWEEAGSVSINNFLTKQEKMDIKPRKEISATISEEEMLIELIEARPRTSVKAASSDISYKIQLGAYSRGVPAYRKRLFDKLSKIRTIESYTDENGVVVYTTGNLNRLEDAVRMQNQIKQEGIQDAKVVPYFKGKRITLEQAKQIEANDDI